LQQVFPNTSGVTDTEDLLPAVRVRLPNTVYVLRDVQTWPIDRDPVLARAIKDLLTWCPAEGSNVVFLGCVFKPHNSFEKLVTMLEFSLPTPSDLEAIMKGIGESAGKTFPDDLEVVRALGGLNTTEAENALSLSLVEQGKFCPETIYREKTLAVKRSGLLEIIDADPRGLDAIGGLDCAKAWALKRKRVYSQEAQTFGLAAPKGVLVVGVPGTGKSLLAKVIGTALGVPTLKLDIGALFNSLVGESEARTRDALKLAEAMAPCVLWVDEIDKGLAGASGGGSNDSGVTKRVLGTILTWLQDRKRPVFLIATANQVEGLPPELLRKGRFDECFAVDLPNAEERQAIFKIHLTKVKRPVDLAQESIIQATEGFTGAEIEVLINDALFDAFDNDRDLLTTDLIAAARATVPLSVTAKEQIVSIREWAKTRARFASTPVAKTQATAGKRKLLNPEGN
jgi:ATP-dependent 26S proteasome regulatory subunit